MRKPSPKFWEIEVRVRPSNGPWKAVWSGSSPKKKRLKEVFARASSRILGEPAILTCGRC